jgi:hypothetical protein
LITQPDHARLAGAIMQHCVALASHPRRTSILLAIAEHDNGWTETDSEPLIDPATGIPLDFISAPNAVRQGVWPRGVARLAHDPWAAALVAQHAIAIFSRYQDNREWAGFFERMERMRNAMLDARPVLSEGLSIDDLAADYRFLGLGDLISLTFCNGWTDVQRFDIWSVHLSGSRVSVLPDPFGGRPFPIEIDAREIPLSQATGRPAFHSDREFREALAAARVTTLKGVIAAQA